jgi:arylsulfatase A-like enzyme
LQASHLGSYGYPLPVSPHLDEFASKSHRFSRVSSVASWTVPASMSWFTGVYPSEHRMTNKFAVYSRTLKKQANLKELAPELVTLAELFRNNGYATAGFTGNAGVSAGFGYEQGFDVYDHEKNKFGSFDRSIPKALEWLTANREKKFFLFLHGTKPTAKALPPVVTINGSYRRITTASLPAPNSNRKSSGRKASNADD